MSESPSPYGAMFEQKIAAQASTQERTAFLHKTYMHLFGAVLAFTGIVAFLISTPATEALIMKMMSGSMTWLLVLGTFLLVSYIAERMAHNAVSLSTQYLGLAIYTVAIALISSPLIWYAANYGGPNVLPTAAIATLGIFGALTAFVFLTKKDFSFLRGVVFMGGMVAIGLIVCSLIFGFELGPIFAVAMIGLMSLWILYDTSKVLHHYGTNQYVAASLALFSSLVVLFWYVLRLLMYLQRD